MKDGYVIKSKNSGQPTKEELELINNYTRRKLTEDEVYVFSVVLCDNDIDREFERFTDKSLDILSEMFVGKTGIMDHEMCSDNQTARIFSCIVETIEDKKNQIDMPYRRLVARAYTPRSEKNEDFILALDSGIKKEVSVGCAVEKITCSICGNEMKESSCEHIKGRQYNVNGKKQLCHAILDNPTDAYEWSFVAVPAQKNAGVIKAFNPHMEGGELKMEDVMKKLNLGESLTLTKNQSRELCEYISDLKKKSEVGKAYLEDLKKEVMKFSAIVQPEIDSKVMKSVVEKMSIEELKSFRDTYKAKMASIIPTTAQLDCKKKEVKNMANTQFKI